VNILSFYPGQQVTLFLEIKDNTGSRVDPVNIPVISRVVFPALTLALDYPQNMIKIDTGIYVFKFTLPSGANAVGSYLADIQYTHPVTNLICNELYQIIVLAPFGNFSVSVGSQ